MKNSNCMSLFDLFHRDQALMENIVWESITRHLGEILFHLEVGLAV